MRFKGYLIMIIIVFFLLVIFCFSCSHKLRSSYLKANYYFQEGNRLYAKEKYKEAKDYYEQAITLNPGLKIVYLYLGSSYSQLYNPKKNEQKNIEYAKKAVKNLKNALQAFPENEVVILSLANIYDKLKEFKLAERYYKMIMEKDLNNLNSYLILAEFYSRYGKVDKAKLMYQKRIELDPLNPEGYQYYSMYLAQNNFWNDALQCCEQWISILLEPTSKHPNSKKIEREIIIGDVNHQRIISDRKKKQLTEALYTHGVVCWTKCYRTSEIVMGQQERYSLVNSGMNSLNTVLKIDPEHHQALVYINLLWRQMGIVDPLNKAKYIKYAETAAKRAKVIREKRIRNQQLKDYLGEPGK
jgi:tetratricopeptide (TPR) repeat protein